jgi:hypothetical protein
VSRGRPKRDEDFSASTVLQMVAWDYQPGSTDESLNSPAGSFLQHIPWDGEDEEPDEDADDT